MKYLIIAIMLLAGCDTYNATVELVNKGSDKIDQLAADKKVRDTITQECYTVARRAIPYEDSRSFPKIDAFRDSCIQARMTP